MQKLLPARARQTWSTTVKGTDLYRNEEIYNVGIHADEIWVAVTSLSVYDLEFCSSGMMTANFSHFSKNPGFDRLIGKVWDGVL